MKFLNGLQPLGLLVLRVCLGIIFVYHGYPKLVHANAGMREFFVMHGLPGYLVPVAGILEGSARCCSCWDCSPGRRRCCWRSRWLWRSGKCIAATDIWR